MIKKRKSLTTLFKITILLCFSVSIIIAQNNSTLWFNKLDKENGLSSNISITGVFQDSEGFVWISTYGGGLNQFDGTNTIHYRANASDTTSLVSDQLFGNIFEDQEKNIWFCSKTSIECYQRKTNDFKHLYILDEEGQPYDFYGGCFYLERDTFLWGRTSGEQGKYLFRLNIYDPSDQQIIGTTQFDIGLIPGLGSDGALKHIFSIDGLKAAGIEVFEYNSLKGTYNLEAYFLKDDPIISLNIHSVIPKNEHQVWLSASQGLYLWDLNNKTAPTQVLSENLHYSILHDSTTLLAKVADKGLIKYNFENQTSTTQDLLLISQVDQNIGSSIKRPFLNYDGTLWMELQKQGLVYSHTKKGKFRFLPKILNNKNSSNYIPQSIIEDSNHQIWYAAYPTGFYQCDSKGKPLNFFAAHLPNYRFPSSRIFKIHEDLSENIWLGTAKGAVVYNAKSKKLDKVLDDDYEEDLYIEDFHQLSNGPLLATSYTHGIFVIKNEGDKWRLSPLSSIKESKHFTSIYEDALQQIYIGFDDQHIRVFQWENHDLVLLSKLEISGSLNGFYEDANNKTIWLATTDGLVSLDKTNIAKKHITFTKEHGLSDNSIQSMAADKKGKLWLGTKNGLNLFNPIDTTFRSFNKSDGIASTEFNKKSILTRKDGSIWVGGSNGFTIIDEPEKVAISQKPIQVQLTDFKINDEPAVPSIDTCHTTGASNISQIKYLKLPPNKNTLSFNFAAIDYSGPSATQLKYKLEPQDKNWVLLERGEYGFSRYANLPSGEYTFKIQGANSDGYWHPASFKELKITIIPHLIEQRWFQILLVLTGLLISYGLYRNRISQIREKASLKTRAAENKMAALVAQMNPHFAFNSLQSLNGIIASNDMMGAFEYVSQFSDLMRMMLENSRENKIALEREINMLELYMEVEAIRFAIPFTYEINVSDEIDIYEIIVPAMLLQPFVENAIKHGLFHKKSKGNLLLSFSKEQSFLKCIIRDDGVGRKAAQKIKSQKGRKHTSRGLEIVKERLAILQQSGYGNVDFQIIDLFGAQQESIGTEVVILLPL